MQKRLGLKKPEHLKVEVTSHRPSRLTLSNHKWDYFHILASGMDDYHRKLKKILFIKELSQLKLLMREGL